MQQNTQRNQWLKSNTLYIYYFIKKALNMVI